MSAASGAVRNNAWVKSMALAHGLLAGMCLLASTAATAVAWAEVPSGPQAGEVAGPLKAFAISGEPKERDVDYATQVKEKPAVVVFVSAKDFDRPMFRFLKKLDGDLPPDTRLVAVWLAEDAAKSKEYLPKITQYFERTSLAVFDGVAGPNGWGVNLDARLTAVVLKEGKTVKSFGYVSLNETNVPEVLAALK